MLITFTMSFQVEEQKTRSLNSLKTYRKQLEGRLKTIKKLMLDVEKASRENEPYSTFESVVTARFDNFTSIDVSIIIREKS